MLIPTTLVVKDGSFNVDKRKQPTYIIEKGKELVHTNTH